MPNMDIITNITVPVTVKFRNRIRELAFRKERSLAAQSRVLLEAALKQAERRSSKSKPTA